MNNYHEQAMRFVYQQVLHRLLGFFSRSERVALQLLIQRLLVAAGGVERIGNYRVMVVHEGGKECAYTLAFLRAAQLSIAGRTPETFVLRIAVLRQPRVTAKVLERIHTQCSELFMYDDPRVELVLVDETQVNRLDKHRPTAVEHLQPVIDRTQVLMSGHLTQGDARATFFYTDFLSRAKLYHRACEWGGEVDALIDRRPPKHLSEYMAWVQRVAKQQGHELNGQHFQGFEGAVKLCSKLDDDYKHLLCLSAPIRSDAVEVVNKVNVINVFDCLSYEIDIFHSKVLIFFEGAWNIKVLDIDEPQAAVVLLAAHLQGLRGIYQEGLEYRVGVEAYLRYIAIENKTSACFKGQLIQHLGGTFNTAKRIDKLRKTVTQYLGELHGVSDEQLGCFMYSPFVEQAHGLEAFLAHRYPEKLQSLDELRRILMSSSGVSTPDALWLESVSGLPLSSLRVLFNMQKTNFTSGNSLIAALWVHDPNNQT